MQAYQIAVLAGDGIGPEVMAEANKVLDARLNPRIASTGVISKFVDRKDVHQRKLVRAS